MDVKYRVYLLQRIRSYGLSGRKATYETDGGKKMKNKSANTRQLSPVDPKMKSPEIPSPIPRFFLLFFFFLQRAQNWIDRMIEIKIIGL